MSTNPVKLSSISVPEGYDLEKNELGFSANPFDDDRFNAQFQRLVTAPQEHFFSSPPRKATSANVSNWNGYSRALENLPNNYDFGENPSNYSADKNNKENYNIEFDEATTSLSKLAYPGHYTPTRGDLKAEKPDSENDLPVYENPTKRVGDGRMKAFGRTIVRSWRDSSKLKKGLIIAGVIALLAIVAFAIAYGVGYAQNAAWVNTMNDALKQAFTTSREWVTDKAVPYVSDHWQAFAIGAGIVAGVAILSIPAYKGGKKLKKTIEVRKATKGEREHKQALEKNVKKMTAEFAKKFSGTIAEQARDYAVDKFLLDIEQEALAKARNKHANAVAAASMKYDGKKLTEQKAIEV